MQDCRQGSHLIRSNPIRSARIELTGADSIGSDPLRVPRDATMTGWLQRSIPCHSAAFDALGLDSACAQFVCFETRNGFVGFKGPKTTVEVRLFSIKVRFWLLQ